MNNQEWNGEGLPPVGVKCEYTLDGANWRSCEIKYIVDGEGAALKAEHVKSEMMFTYENYENLDFRPIKPEKSERDKAVEEAKFMIGVTGNQQMENAVELMIDAGYRKVNELTDEDIFSLNLNTLKTPPGVHSARIQGAQWARDFILGKAK